MSARILTEGTRHLVGLGSSAQFRDLPVLEDGLAIDGILKSSSSASRCSTRASSFVTRSSQSTPGCVCAGWALGGSCAVRCVLTIRTSAPLWDCRARGEERDQTSESRPAPRVSIIASSSAPRRDRASVTFGLGAEVLPAGSVAATHVTPFPRPKQEMLTFGMRCRAGLGEGTWGLRHVRSASGVATHLLTAPIPRICGVSGNAMPVVTTSGSTAPSRLLWRVGRAPGPATAHAVRARSDLPPVYCFAADARSQRVEVAGRPARLGVYRVVGERWAPLERPRLGRRSASVASLACGSWVRHGRGGVHRRSAVRCASS